MGAALRLILYRIFRTISIRLISPEEYNWFKVSKASNLVINKNKQQAIINVTVNGQQLKPVIRRRGSDIAVFRQIFILNEYLPAIQLLQSMKRPVKVIVDAGANIGLTSIQLASYFHEAKILSIEADPQNFEVLKKNLNTHFPERIQPINRALWSTNATLNLTQDNTRSYWARSVSEHSVANGYSVKGFTIEDLQQETQHQVIDFLKIDIEGAEASFFENRDHSSNLLLSIAVLAIELHGDEIFEKKFKELLHETGFLQFHSGESLFAVNKNKILDK